MLELQEQFYMQQQMEQEYLKAMGEGSGESDDGLILAQANPLPPRATSWIQWYLSLEDHEFLMEIDKEFLEDKSNLLQIKREFKGKFSESMRLINSTKIPLDDDLQNQKLLELIQDASDLYGLLHRRYIQSSLG